jgi:hypothetical protein
MGRDVFNGDRVGEGFLRMVSQHGAENRRPGCLNGLVTRRRRVRYHGVMSGQQIQQVNAGR